MKIIFFLSKAVAGLSVFVCFYLVFVANPFRIRDSSGLDVSGVLTDREIPEFRLYDFGNFLFTKSSLLGKPYLIYFVYGNCKSVCSVGISKLEKYASRNALSAYDLALISLNPEKDRKEDSNLFRSVAHWKKAPLLLFPENRSEAESLARSFRISVFSGSEDEILHSDLLFVTEGNGKIAAVIPDFSETKQDLSSVFTRTFRGN
ncbi:SCO family protein [Leptospira ellisii]|uniref:SCO family protein n=1 Tax=Leptospira ellisii TaxID=2023197 RepID=A0AAE4QQR3_9LEPT|nr:SCO family protein [Leptospira ellisii]MDV6237373.1 SCO family protein [Leptospira ellisii]